MSGKLNSSFFSQTKNENLKKDINRIEIILKPSQTYSEIIRPQGQKMKYKIIKSQPVLESINEGEVSSIPSMKSLHSPKFNRVTNEQSSINHPSIKFTFQSPQVTRIPKLIHQPAQQKKQQVKPTINRVIIPPSDLVHDKMKNFAQNPQSFLINIDQQLDKVFKKSITSIIRNAKEVPVLDASIHDSTDLLKGYKEN